MFEVYFLRKYQKIYFQDLADWKHQCQQKLRIFLDNYCFKTTSVAYFADTSNDKLSSNCMITFSHEDQGPGFSVTIAGIEKEVVKQKYLIERYNEKEKKVTIE